MGKPDHSEKERIERFLASEAASAEREAAKVKALAEQPKLQPVIEAEDALEGMPVIEPKAKPEAEEIPNEGPQTPEGMPILPTRTPQATLKPKRQGRQILKRHASKAKTAKATTRTTRRA